MIGFGCQDKFIAQPMKIMKDILGVSGKYKNK
jgi:hypothetical protein